MGAGYGSAGERCMAISAVVAVGAIADPLVAVLKKKAAEVKIGPGDFTKPAQAEDFVKRTGVERLAIVFGNIHGIVTNQKETLDIPHLKQVVAEVPDVYLVLHGASGLTDSDVREAIAAGITNVHFSTELRVAYQEGIKDEFSAHPAQTTPAKYLAPAADKVRDLVASKVRLFMGR